MHALGQVSNVTWSLCSGGLELPHAPLAQVVQLLGLVLLDEAWRRLESPPGRSPLLGVVGRRAGPSEHQQREGSVREGPPGSDPGAQALVRICPCVPPWLPELWRSFLRTPSPSPGQQLPGCLQDTQAQVWAPALDHQRAVEGRGGCRLCRGASSSWGQDQGSPRHLWAPGLVGPRRVSARSSVH